MAQQSIGIGSTANDSTGDTLRVAGVKINENFTELYSSTLLQNGAVTEAGEFLNTARPKAGTLFVMQRPDLFQDYVVFPDGSNDALSILFSKDVDGYYSWTDLGRRPDSIDRSVISTRDSTSTWTIISPSSSTVYTQTIGAEVTAEFYGKSLSFKSYKDDRGGIWDIYIDGTLHSTISTYSASAAPDSTTVVASALSEGKHTVRAVFAGDDPTNAPSTGAGTARGWLYQFTDGREDAGGPFLTKTVNNAFSLAGESIIPSGLLPFAVKMPDNNFSPYHGVANVVRNATVSKTFTNSRASGTQNCIECDNVVTVVTGDCYEAAGSTRYMSFVETWVITPDHISMTIKLTIEANFTPPNTSYVGMLPLAASPTNKILLNNVRWPAPLSNNGQVNYTQTPYRIESQYNDMAISSSEVGSEYLQGNAYDRTWANDVSAYYKIYHQIATREYTAGEEISFSRRLFFGQSAA